MSFYDTGKARGLIQVNTVSMSVRLNVQEL